MQRFAVQIPPPGNWQDFETLCCELWRRIWKDPNAQRHGRQGHPQYGVDVFGRPDRRDRWAGVQCKGKDSYTDKRLTEKEIKGEVKKAKSFRPELSEFIIATTAPRNDKDQELARVLTEEHQRSGLFSVHIWSWEDVVESEHFWNVAEKYYSDWFRAFTGVITTRHFSVPYEPNPWFAGREEVLLELRERLTKDQTAALGQAIRGLGGIGKTQTAVEYVYRHRDEYQAVFWLTADTELGLKNGFLEIGERLRLPFDRSKPDEAIPLVKRWLEANGDWLLVFDNADEPGLVKPFLPAQPKGHILLTSRAHVFDALDMRRPLELPRLPIEEATSFLLSRTERDANDASQRAAAEQLRFSAFVGPDDVPFQLVARGASELGPALSQVLGDADADPVAVNEPLEPLARFSLIHVDTDKQTYSIHRLVQEVLKDAMDATTRRLWAERTVRALGRAFPSVEYANWSLCHSLLPHATVATDLVGQHGFVFVEAASLLNNTAGYLYEQGQYAPAEPLYLQALEISRKALGENHPIYLIILENHGKLQEKTGGDLEGGGGEGVTG